MISVVKVSDFFAFQDPAAGICFFPLKTIQRRPYDAWMVGRKGRDSKRPILKFFPSSPRAKPYSGDHITFGEQGEEV